MSVDHTVIETPGFLREARQAGIGGSERSSIVLAFARNPSSGDEIVGTGGARKTRFAGRGKGKSGGYRVVSFYAGADVPVFLMHVFSKGERVDLSQAERNELRAILTGAVEAYRRGVRDHVQGG